MTDTIKGAIYGVMATLIVGIIAGIFSWKQYEIQAEQLAFQKQQAVELQREKDAAKREAEAYRQTLKEAPKKFVRRFGTLIQNAAAETERKEGRSGLIPMSRAIVSQRDALRNELNGLNKLLNSDIDRLAAELDQPNPDENKVREIVETLKAKWSLKEEEMAFGIRRLMGVLEVLLEAEKLAPTQ